MMDDDEDENEERRTSRLMNIICKSHDIVRARINAKSWIVKAHFVAEVNILDFFVYHTLYAYFFIKFGPRGFR